MSALSLGLSRTGVKSYQVLSNALAALAEAGTPTPCAGRKEWASPRPKDLAVAVRECQDCPLKNLCGEHGRKYETTGVWGGDEAPPETTPGRDRPGGRGMNTIPNPVQVALRRERRARKTAQRNAHELQKKNTLLRQCVARLQHEIRQLEEEKNQ